jgi:uncharacterized protein YvpB
MTRFRLAIISFMVIANLGLWTAFALWMLVDGELAGRSVLPVVSAQGTATDALKPSPSAPATATGARLAVPPASPTPGWTPPALTLAPLPTQGPTLEPANAEPQPAASAAPTEAPPVGPDPNSLGPNLTLPASARVTGVVGHRQSLPLSCEARSAADWAAYFGVIIDEVEFLNALPISDDPDRGFVGDVHGEWGNLPPQAYGVHAAPVARLLRDFGMPADSQRYMAWDGIRAEISAGRPVLVWVTGHVEAGEGVVYTAADGRQTIVAPFEHTVIVVGYDEDSVLVVDGANTYRRSLDRFLASWGALRNMAITAAP